MRTIVVDPYQIGQDNPEALKSGAFYFYHHLGFRPRDPAVSRIARAEQDKIAARPGYRSPLPVLRQLARSEVFLSLAGEETEAERSLTASRLAALVTDHVARRFEGDRAGARHHAATHVARALGVPGWTRWPADERRGFAQLALLISLIPDLDRWPSAGRRRLVSVMRAKGGATEARYVALLDAHTRLRRSLEALVGAGQGAPPGA
jgi:hypothetical protein